MNSLSREESGLNISSVRVNISQKITMFTMNKLSSLTPVMIALVLTVKEIMKVY